MLKPSDYLSKFLEATRKRVGDLIIKDQARWEGTTLLGRAADGTWVSLGETSISEGWVSLGSYLLTNPTPDFW